VESCSWEMRVSSSASVAMSAPVRLRRRAAFTANHQSADPPLGFGDRDADVLVVVQEQVETRLKSHLRASRPTSARFAGCRRHSGR
jgi:hypothetical protein